MAHASLERQLAAAQTTKLELESKLKEKGLLIERLEGDRRRFAEREKEEREKAGVSLDDKESQDDETLLDNLVKQTSGKLSFYSCL